MKMKKFAALVCSAALFCSAFSCMSYATETGDEEEAETETTTEYQLSNPNADEKTQSIYDYICEIFGTYMLSAQQESTWMGSPDYEMDYIEETTGKLPAIRSLDFMNDDFSGVVQRAIEWDAKGGLVTICWHCGVDGKGYTEALGDDPDFDLLLTEGTDEYNAMMESWDNAANALLQLQDAGVTVLWRPFHEFDGQWFWWGKGGAENFIKLWQLMYDTFTEEYGLNNLIWVLGYSGDVKDGWYPGDEYCDIIGSDSYSNSTHLSGWTKLQDVTDAFKPLAYHECGYLPSVDDFVNDGCIWSWFMVWHTDYIIGNDVDNLIEVYNSDLVITLDELPDFGTGDEADESDAEASETEENVQGEDGSSEETEEAGETSVSETEETSDEASSGETSAAEDTADDDGFNPMIIVAVAIAIVALCIVVFVLAHGKKKE